MDYPIFDVAFGGGVLMGTVAIAHVIVSHFAIGGGLVIAITETLAVRRGDRELRELARRSSLMLILVATVFGAISGVGIWVVAGLIAPAAISALIHTYVWAWAIEWVFFFVEIVAALVYWTTWDKISKRAHLAIGWVYFVGAYLSLVAINGIITFQLTPGRWIETRSFWDGFLNPTYFPALVLRSGIVLILATAFMVFPALRAAPEARPRLMRYLGTFLAVGVALAFAGFRWWELTLPAAVSDLFLGDPPGLTELADTRAFLLAALAAALAIGMFFLVALPRAARVVAAVLLLAASSAFFGGYERLREGVRKPYLIHGYMFSNGVRVDEIADLREHGVLQRSAWAARQATDDPAARGRQLFRSQCASCHTLDGYQALRPLLPEDPDMIYSVLYSLYDQAEPFLALAPGETVDAGDLPYPFMPPFAGTEEEMEDLVAYLAQVVAPTEGVEVVAGELAER